MGVSQPQDKANARQALVEKHLLSMLEGCCCLTVGRGADLCREVDRETRVLGTVENGEIRASLETLADKCPQIVRLPWGYAWVSYAFNGRKLPEASHRETRAKCLLAEYVYHEFLAPKIAQGDARVLLDGGSSVLALAWEIAQHSPPFGQTGVGEIHTHALAVVSCLSQWNVDVHGVSGQLRREDGIMVGSDAEEALRRHRGKKGLAIVGINRLQGGALWCANRQVAALRRVMLQVGDPALVVADATKFGPPAPSEPVYDYAELRSAGRRRRNVLIVTNDPCDSEGPVNTKAYAEEIESIKQELGEDRLKVAPSNRRAPQQ